MAKLTQEMKDMVGSQQCFFATVNADGTPNVAPKRSTRVLDDESLIFTEGTNGRTFANIRRDPRVAVGVVNREIPDGYRFIGHCTVEESGPRFDMAAEMSMKMGMPKPVAVVIVHIDEIHSLRPGPMAGKKIG